MLIYIPLLVCLLGLIIYASDPKKPPIVEISRLAFACGLLVTLFQLATGVIHS